MEDADAKRNGGKPQSIIIKRNLEDDDVKRNSGKPQSIVARTVSKERFQLVLAAISVAMAILWAIMLTTGDDDLFWTWAILSPVYLIFLGHNFLLRDGMIKKSIPFAASYALACLIWVVFWIIHGHPWGWSSEQFNEMMGWSILPPIILTIWNENFVKPSEIQSLQRIGIVASLPFCVTGFVGLIFFIPTLILLSFGRVFFYNREKRMNESISE